MSLLATYATGLGALLAVTVAWIAVQGVWRRAFPERMIDPDPMLGRLGCAPSCGTDAPCPHRDTDGACRRKEE
jgi:hypothetical protein